MKKKTETIEEFLKKKIKSSKNLKLLKDNENFFNYGFDSLNFLKLIFEIEKKYKISINHKNYSKLYSIKKLEIYIKKILK